ncbi:hypothetical protein E4T56_gene15754, partial [Termitomyces sp. T112]
RTGGALPGLGVVGSAAARACAIPIGNMPTAIADVATDARLSRRECPLHHVRFAKALSPAYFKVAAGWVSDVFAGRSKGGLDGLRVIGLQGLDGLSGSVRPHGTWHSFRHDGEAAMKMARYWRLTTALGLAVWGGAVQAASLALSPVWGDHGVIQREAPIVVGGTAMPGAMVKALLGAVERVRHRKCRSI